MFAELIPAAIGIAANPPAIVAVIALLAPSAPKRAAAAFVGGWIAGLTAAGALIIAAGDLAEYLGDPTLPILALKLLIGLALVALGARKLLKRDRTAEEPAWMRSLSGLSAPKAFGVAALFSAANPKTLAFNAAACLTIADSGLTIATEVAVFAVFVALSSVSVALPLLFALIAGKGAEVRLAGARDWLVRNGAAVTGALLLVLGVLLVSGTVQKLAAMM